MTKRRQPLGEQLHEPLIDEARCTADVRDADALVQRVERNHVPALCAGVQFLDAAAPVDERAVAITGRGRGLSARPGVADEHVGTRPLAVCRGIPFRCDYLNLQWGGVVVIGRGRRATRQPRDALRFSAAR